MTQRGVRFDLRKVEELVRKTPRYAPMYRSYLDGEGWVRPVWEFDGNAVGLWSSKTPTAPLFMHTQKCLHEDNVCVSYRAQQVAVAVHMAGQADFIETYRSCDDVHLWVAEKLGIGEGLIGPSHINSAKQLSYEVLYNIRNVRTSHFGRLWLATFPAMAAHIEKIRIEAICSGELITPVLEHRMKVESEAHSYGQYLQATCADIMKCAVARCQLEGVPVCAVVHDTLIVPKEARVAAESAMLLEGSRYGLQVLATAHGDARRQSALSRLLEDEEL